MVRTIWGSVVPGALVLFAVTGCPGKIESSPTSACKSYYAALVEHDQRCEIYPSRIVSAQARFEEQCADNVTAPGASQLAASLDRCASEIRQASCSDPIPCLSETTTGDLADGAPCGGGFQCKGGRCEKPSDATCGVCTSPERVPVGGPCGNGAGDCVEGAECHFSDDGGKCVGNKLAEAGEPCGRIGDTLAGCAKGLHCLLASESSPTGTCRAPVGVGGDCRSKLDCVDGLTCRDNECVARLPEGAACEPSDRFSCAKGLACDGTCKKMLWVGTGEACDLITRWCARGDCIGITNTGPELSDFVPGKCVDQLHEGADCDEPERYPRCEPPARCIQGRCTVATAAACH